MNCQMRWKGSFTSASTVLKRKGDRKRVVRVNLSLEKGFLDTLDEAARMRGMTRSAFVQKAATREIIDPV